MNLFVRDLTVIDSSYICEHRGVVGESWILDVTMSGELNEMSMVLDFSKVKKQIKSLRNEEFHINVIFTRIIFNTYVFILLFCRCRVKVKN